MILSNVHSNVQFRTGHLGEQDSLFSYGDLNYSSINDGHLDFVPTFFDELNITQDVIDACGSNQACILDASLTGNVDIGTSTLDKSMENKELEKILGKSKMNACTVLYYKIIISSIQPLSNSNYIEKQASCLEKIGQHILHPKESLQI